MLIGCIIRNFTFLPAHWLQKLGRFYRLMDINFEGMATKINIWWFRTGERVVQHWGENCPYTNLRQTLLKLTSARATETLLMLMAIDSDACC
jgi:hypothetical protein